MSSLDSVSVFDTSDPLHPRLTGTLANLVFENEAMSYGERRKADGLLERFVLVGNDLYNVTADGPAASSAAGSAAARSSSSTSPTRRTRTSPRAARLRAPPARTRSQCMTVACNDRLQRGRPGAVLDHRPARPRPIPSRRGTAPSGAAGAERHLHDRRRPLLGRRLGGHRLAHRLGRRGGVRRVRPDRPESRSTRTDEHGTADAVERLHPPQLATAEREPLPRGMRSRASAAATSCS